MFHLDVLRIVISGCRKVEKIVRYTTSYENIN
jgi:hypothetical protein